MADPIEKKGLSVAEIKIILESGDFEQLIGARESDCFEAKSAHPFNFDEGYSQVFRLAKYLASFGNNKGGIVVCGLTTEEDNVSPVDFVTGLDLVPEDKFYKSEELIGRGQSAVHPKINDIDAKWFPSTKDKNVGIGAIFIPEQPAGKKYFLVIGNREIEGEEIKGEFYGIPVRNGAQTDWLSSDKVHALALEKPTDFELWRIGISQRLDGIDTKLDRFNPRPPSSAKSDALARKIKEVFGHE